MRLRRPLAALLLVGLAQAAGSPPAAAQIDTEEERAREAAKDEERQKRMPAWQYDLYRRQRDRNKLKEQTELDRLVEAARLFPLVGKDPPSFSLVRSDGKRVGLSDFSGQVVLLYFWSTASLHASEELTSTIDTLQRQYLPRRLVVLAVAVKEKKEDFGPWLKSRALSPVFLLDSDGGVADVYRVGVLPTAYLIDRDHKLVGRAKGTRVWLEGPSRELLDYLVKSPAR